MFHKSQEILYHPISTLKDQRWVDQATVINFVNRSILYLDLHCQPRSNQNGLRGGKVKKNYKNFKSKDTVH